MLIFIIGFICGYFLSNNKIIKPYIISNINTISNSNTGIDERYKKNVKEEYSIEKMKEIFNKKKLLDILQNKDLSIITKTYLVKNFISEEKICPSNIFAGDLLHDFDL